MDGNRRFGRKVNVDSGKGYYFGYSTLEKMLAICMELGIKVVTVYAFSIENFKRPPDQVECLMELAKSKLTEMCEESELVKRYGIGIRVLGDTSLLPEDVQAVVNKAVELTKHNNRAILNMCFPYTSREELTMATKALVEGVEANELDPSDITSSVLEQSLYTRSCPPMDLLIRTSGENRLSDFMLWQSSRTCHIEFIDCYWPEFSFWRMLPVLLRYQLRARSFAAARRAIEARDQQVLLESIVRAGLATVREAEKASNDNDDSTHSYTTSALSSSPQSNPTSLLQRRSPSKHSSSDDSTTSNPLMYDEQEMRAWRAEQKDRVASFLTQRGYIPNCPLVQLH
ncbi:cis-prenyltransferase [Actinomortierella ambigua]|uniref:Alkyl transferase n=1 Tax=Actinomortierella ambigua TaxID=1343610 RepID=A0A9P6UA63_9FUNG|nr:cis-prenyltransferase [Actinomortierella ambigua]